MCHSSLWTIVTQKPLCQHHFHVYLFAAHHHPVKLSVSEMAEAFLHHQYSMFPFGYGYGVMNTAYKYYQQQQHYSNPSSFITQVDYFNNSICVGIQTPFASPPYIHMYLFQNMDKMISVLNACDILNPHQRCRSWLLVINWYYNYCISCLARLEGGHNRWIFNVCMRWRDITGCAIIVSLHSKIGRWTQ